METKPSIKIFLIPTILFAALFALAGDAKAERFFQKNSTWYEKIPANPKITPNSANYIADLLINGNWMELSFNNYGVPVYHALINTANVTVPVTHAYHKAYIMAQGWNVVPIPVGALPAGNAYSCAGAYVDGHMLVISYDSQYMWEFFEAEYCNGNWSANIVRKWDLNGDGINSPYDMHGGARYASTPLAHGLLTYNEIANNTIDHALSFCYFGIDADPHQDIYPSEFYNSDTNVNGNFRTWAMVAGMRLQLNPTVDCSSISGLKVGGKRICKALQDYGMILVDTCGKGYTDIYAEVNPGFSTLVGDISNIPMNQFRVVDPICSNCSTCPNCVTADTTPPASPTGLTVL